MNEADGKWDYCVEHYNQNAFDFYSQFFSDSSRHCLFVGGGGFDPRSNYVIEKLSEVLGARLHALLIREERPDPDKELIARAEKNIEKVKNLVSSHEIISVNIFADDNAVVGGINITNNMKGRTLSGYTDVVVDISALSVGISFPLVRFIYELAKQTESLVNVHLAVTSCDEIDACIKSTPIDAATDIRGFSIPNLLGEGEKAKLWLPLISPSKKGVLNRIHRTERPHDTCPILPFPSVDPKKGDKIAAEFIAEFESEWQVDIRNFVYADEKRPLDLYRTIMRIDEERRPVFETFGGSMLILSPLGGRMPAIGMLMAALERKFPVVYVEALEYDVDWAAIDATSIQHIETAHVWLFGEAYLRDKEK